MKSNKILQLTIAMLALVTLANYFGFWGKIVVLPLLGTYMWYKRSRAETCLIPFFVLIGMGLGWLTKIAMDPEVSEELFQFANKKITTGMFLEWGVPVFLSSVTGGLFYANRREWEKRNQQPAHTLWYYLAVIMLLIIGIWFLFIMQNVGEGQKTAGILIICWGIKMLFKKPENKIKVT